MKKALLILVSLSVLAFLTGCATTSIKYEENLFNQNKVGGISILLARAVPQLTVVIDDKIIIDARVWGTRRVNIENVPEGEHVIKLFANSWQLKESFAYEQKLVVKHNDNKPIMVQVPPYSTMYWVYIIGVLVVSALPTVIVYY